MVCLDMSVFNLKEVLESIDLNDPEFPRRLRDAEDDIMQDEKSPTPSLKSKVYSYYAQAYLKKFNKIKRKEEVKEEIDSLIPHFFLRKIVHFGNKSYSYHNNINPGFLPGIMGCAYVEFARDRSPKLEEICLEKGVSFLKRAVREASLLSKESKQLIFGYAGQSFLNAYFIKTKSEDRGMVLEKLEDSDIENLVAGIACDELSEEYDNFGEGSYRRISKGYGCLSLLARKIDCKKIIEITRKLLTNKTFKPFYEYNGWLREIADLNGEHLKERIQIITIEHALKAFKKGHMQQGFSEDSLTLGLAGNLCLDLGNFILESERVIQKGDLEGRVVNLLNFLDIGNDKDLIGLAYLTYKKSTEYYEESRKYGNDKPENNSKLGEAYSGLAMSSDKLVEKYKNLFKSIINYELSRDTGNKNSAINYQVIGREYYSLQHSINDDFKNEAGEITPLRIKEIIKEVINEELGKKGKQGLIFERYRGGGLQDINNIEDNISNLGLEIQWIVLQSALKSFVKSALAGDGSPGNKSYQGKCITEIARLNNWLKRYSGAEIREKLEDAEKKLRIVLEWRVKERPEDLYKDYSRLAECQFRLAGLVNNDLDRKRNLYEHSKQNNKDAKNLLDRQEKPVNPEIYNFIASSYDKLAEISLDKNVKKMSLREAVKYFNKTKKAGDSSSENRSKKGSCLLNLLKIESKERLTRKKIYERVREIKRILEEAVDINKKKRGYFVYPLFQLYYLSKDIEEMQISGVTKDDLKGICLRSSIEYIKDALNVYTTNQEWAIRQISESANFVCGSMDNYGLLENTLIFKQGEPEKLDLEIKVTNNLRSFLNELSDGTYIAPKPIGIIKHEDKKNPKLSGSYYAMSRKQGFTLEEILYNKRKTEGKKSEILMRVVDYLAFIHAKLPSDEQPQDYRFKVGEKLDKLENLSFIDSLTKKQITDNYSPIIESFQGATLVFNKDAHPGNWIITSNGGLCGIDFEDRGLVPMEFDLVNLMEYGDYFDNDEKDRCLESYVSAFRSYKNEDSFEVSKLRYLNALVHRGISFVTAWSSPDMEGMRSRRRGMLSRVLNAIDKIENDFSDYYTKYSSEYGALKKGFHEIQISVGL